jgi:type IV pilus assembly protein PilC
VADTYEYRARDAGGRLLTGTLIADSQDLVLARLREMGYVPLRVGVQTLGLKREINIFNRVRLKHLAVFSRQFSAMVSSGLPILRALSILELQTESKPLAKTVTEVRLDVERGSSLSAAMARHTKVFNNLYVAMVRSGEAGGNLEAVLERIATTLEREVSLRHRIRSAMTYPIVVLGFVSLILAAMLLFIVPQFKDIYADLGGELPFATQVLISVSDTLRTKFLWVVAIGAAAVYLLRRYARTAQGREAWDRLKLKFPVFGSLFQKTALARFARTLGTLNKSGVPILQTLDVVRETVNNSQISAAVKDVQQSVMGGESLTKPLLKHKVFPPMVTRMLAVGEETGQLDSMLDKVADYYDDEVTATVDSLTSIIEPLMIFVVGGAVGLAVIALYLPMFNIINLIK